jgi:tRNA (cmo5U34)-methyltransferase
MSVESGAGDPVHLPKRRDLFKFDDEVASIFDNMAPRSIPLYNEVHRLHVSLVWKALQPGAVVVDVGSSTGHLFRNIERQLRKPFAETGLRGYAVDASGHMMDRLTREFPTVTPIIGDIAFMQPLAEKADVLFCLYTLQFVPEERKSDALHWLVDSTKIGGAVVFGQKDRILNPAFEIDFNDEYYLFRRDNGYTQEEIDAKTEALKNSMWPVAYSDLARRLAMLGVQSHETTRWLQFSTLLGYRRF